MYAYRAKFASKRGRKDKACYGVVGSRTRFADGGILRRVALWRCNGKSQRPAASSTDGMVPGTHVQLVCLPSYPARASKVVPKWQRIALRENRRVTLSNVTILAVGRRNSGERRCCSVPTRVWFGFCWLWLQSRHLPHMHRVYRAFLLSFIDLFKKNDHKGSTYAGCASVLYGQGDIVYGANHNDQSEYI
ncbi:unnamed protein product [Ixodes pacificus]